VPVFLGFSATEKEKSVVVVESEEKRGKEGKGRERRSGRGESKQS
jgi:hypothetical protein